MRIFKREKEQTKELPSELEELREDVRQTKMPEPVEKVAYKEIERLTKTSPSSAEYTIGINYIDYLTSLPWNRSSEDRLDLQKAKDLMDNAIILDGRNIFQPETVRKLGFEYYSIGRQ